MKRTSGFTADDGTWYATSAECREYEDYGRLAKLVNLKHDDLARALSREDIELADAIEHIGNRIAAKRRESGELKRAKKIDEAFSGVEKGMKKAAK